MKSIPFEILGVLWVLAALGVTWIIRSKKIQSGPAGALSLIVVSYFVGLAFLAFILISM